MKPRVSARSLTNLPFILLLLGVLSLLLTLFSARVYQIRVTGGMIEGPTNAIWSRTSFSLGQVNRDRTFASFAAPRAVVRSIWSRYKERILLYPWLYPAGQVAELAQLLLA